MAPVVDRLTEEYDGSVEIRAMNVENDQTAADLATTFRVQYVPTFVFVRQDGSVSDTLVGEVSEDALRDKLDALR